MDNMDRDTSIKQCPVRPCIGQVGPSAIDVTINPIGDCCTNLIQEVEPISIYMKEITASILKGVVNCGTSEIGVEGVIVVATGPTGDHYVGVTNEDGEYSICVPGVGANISYSIEAYCCSSCSGNVCEDADCDCGCKDTLIPV